MEKHILTYTSGGTDKTAVAITKIRNSGTDIIGEIVYMGTDEGAVILEDLIEHPGYNALAKEVKELRDAAERRRERTIRKVEQALGLKLYDWQKAFIFYNKPYNYYVSGSVSIPYPGNMKITVEMTEGLFEEFLQFRKSKDEYDNRASKEIEGLRRRMEFLAKAVINSVEGETAKAKKEAKEEALELANDWFC